MVVQSTSHKTAIARSSNNYYKNKNRSGGTTRDNNNGPGYYGGVSTCRDDIDGVQQWTAFMEPRVNILQKLLRTMANTISIMANVIRIIASKNRKRYTENGFNLDLAYIAENIIAMGFPAKNLESLYRNRYADVYKCLEENHPEHYKIYNLCLERGYDPNKFHGRVASYPFEDHNPPTIELIQKFCEDVDTWLKSHDCNVAVVHCKAGKGRTGTMISCYLVYSGHQSTADEALSCYDDLRTEDGKGVTIPSQRRYVQYFSQLIQSRKTYERRNLQLCEIRFIEASLLQTHGTVHCSISVLQNTAIGVEVQPLQSMLIDFRKSSTLDLNPALAVCGDIKIELTPKKYRKNKICHFWFNTYFVSDSKIFEGEGVDKKIVYTLSKWEIDDAHKDKEHKCFSDGFKVQLVFFADSVNNRNQLAVNNRISNNQHTMTSVMMANASAALSAPRLAQKANSSGYAITPQSTNCFLDQKSSSSPSVCSLEAETYTGGSAAAGRADEQRHSLGNNVNTSNAHKQQQLKHTSLPLSSSNTSNNSNSLTAAAAAQKALMLSSSLSSASATSAPISPPSATAAAGQHNLHNDIIMMRNRQAAQPQALAGSNNISPTHHPQSFHNTMMMTAGAVVTSTPNAKQQSNIVGQQQHGYYNPAAQQQYQPSASVPKISRDSTNSSNVHSSNSNSQQMLHFQQQAQQQAQQQQHNNHTTTTINNSKCNNSISSHCSSAISSSSSSTSTNTSSSSSASNSAANDNDNEEDWESAQTTVRAITPPPIAAGEEAAGVHAAASGCATIGCAALATKVAATADKMQRGGYQNNGYNNNGSSKRRNGVGTDGKAMNGARYGTTAATSSALGSNCNQIKAEANHGIPAATLVTNGGNGGGIGVVSESITTALPQPPAATRVRPRRETT